MDAGTRGDPELPLRWTSKSVRKLADGLRKLGHQVSYRTVARLLRELGYGLQANRKTHEGSDHPDRDVQFERINQTARAAIAAGEPVISVDTKKKELIGEFKNGGREWAPAGEPVQVNTHDFPSMASGKAIPYGIYDLAHDEGWVSVGIDHDTAQFAAASIQGWWQHLGRERFPNATSLTITADCGGSNNYRTRLWKTELQKLADTDRPHAPRLPLPAGHQQMEQNRAPPVQLHQHQLARQTTHQPPDRDRPDRRHNNPRRAQGLRPPRHQHLPRQDHDHRCRTRSRPNPQRPVPPRVELHDHPTTFNPSRPLSAVLLAEQLERLARVGTGGCFDDLVQQSLRARLQPPWVGSRSRSRRRGTSSAVRRRRGTRL